LSPRNSSNEYWSSVKPATVAEGQGIGQMMKALRFSTFGAPSVLSIEEVPTPEPRAGEALVRVIAAAINPSDVKNVSGHFKSPLPRVPGRDYAGVVVAGDAEKGLEVWGSGAGFGVGRDGAHAEFLVVPAAWISPKPSLLSMEQAAAIGVPYLAAWLALVRAGNVQAGETVLVVGVSGAVGRAATQIAHWKKARARRVHPLRQSFQGRRSHQYHDPSSRPGGSRIDRWERRRSRARCRGRSNV
jgi:NADPH:quinone reductase-like Zn-dependent oxidoreductase